MTPRLGYEANGPRLKLAGLTCSVAVLNMSPCRYTGGFPQRPTPSAQRAHLAGSPHVSSSTLSLWTSSSWTSILLTLTTAPQPHSAGRGGATGWWRATGWRGRPTSQFVGNRSAETQQAELFQRPPSFSTLDSSGAA